MPKVSVIIPIFGVEKYIERCARSLFEQTLDDIEYLFVDDCSPDDSVNILMKVLEDYPNRKNQVVLHHMAKNSGQAAVRKWGMLNATGEYITQCDSDDWVDVTIYQKLYEKAITDNSDIVVCGYLETDGRRIISEGRHVFDNKEEYLQRMLYSNETWAVWDKICKRDLVRGIEFPQYNMGEDMLLTFQIVLNANRVSIVSECLYKYFYNSASITKVCDEDKCYSNWKQSTMNAERTFSILNKANLSLKFADAIEYQRYKQKLLAGKLACNYKYSKEWLNVFSSVHNSFWHLKNLSIVEKCKFFAVLVLAKMVTYLRCS